MGATVANRGPRVSMIGRHYRWRGAIWIVRARWCGAGPRNVLIEAVEGPSPGQRVVRPFRGLRKIDRG